MESVAADETFVYDPHDPRRALPARNLYRREVPELAAIIPEIHRACLNGHTSLIKTIIKLDHAAANSRDSAQQVRKTLLPTA